MSARDKDQAGLALQNLARRRGDFADHSSYSGTAGYHNAAKTNRTNRDWRTWLTSADQQILDDLSILLARARSSVANDGYAASIMGAYRREVVGSGITARAAARHPKTNAMLESFNAKVDRLWDDWWNSTACDVEMSKIGGEKQALWMNELTVAGEIFVVESYQRDRDNIGLRLQEIEAEMIDNTITEYEGRPVRGGVEIGTYGEPVAYHIHVADHPLENYASKSQRIFRDRVYHLYRQDRVRQRRGKTWLTAVLPGIRSLAMYEQYMQAKARTEAAYNGFVKQDANGGREIMPGMANKTLGAPNNYSDTPDELEIRVEQGLFPVLKPGQDVVFPQPSSPNSQYQPFVAEQLKRLSAGTGLDLATVARWYADGNFSSQRQAKLELQAEIEPIQQTLFINKTMKPIRRRFLETAILEGRLNAPGYWENPQWRAAYLATNWQGPPRRSIDPAKDAAAAKILMSLGLMSPDDYFNERGLDKRDVYAAIAEARKLAKSLGIDDIIGAALDKTDPREPRPDKDDGNLDPERGTSADDLAAAIIHEAIKGATDGEQGETQATRKATALQPA